MVTGAEFIHNNLSHVAVYESEKIIYYFGIKEDRRAKDPILILMSVSKMSGEYLEIDTYQISDEISSQAVGLVYRKMTPAISYVVGTKTGGVRIYPFGEKDEITKMKVHTVPVKCIEFAKKNQGFNHRSIALVMTEDHSVFTVNL